LGGDVISTRICRKQSTLTWNNFYENFKIHFGGYPNFKTYNYFQNTFSKIRQLQEIFTREKDIIQDKEGFIKTKIHNVLYDNINTKAAEAVKRKYKGKL
jgi:hypothetical protein